MSVLWVTLFLLHQGYALVPVVTAQPGEPVTLTCTFKEKFDTATWLHWYKQSAGEDLNMILKQRQNVPANYGPEFSASRFKTTYDNKISNLTILSPTQQDEGMYHCAVIDWTKATWTATYLSIKGNGDRRSTYTVDQSAVSGPARPAETLQCSVLSDSQNKACSDDLSVFWFRAGSDKSYPNIIYTDGNRADECKKTSETQRRCSYNFSKNISSDDEGTIYCAVATCGQIVFGNATNLKKEKMSSFKINMLLVTVSLAISLTVNIVLICYSIQRSACRRVKENSSSQERQTNVSRPEDITEDGQDLNYAPLHFTGGKNTGGQKKRALKTEESVYSQAKSISV